MANKTNNRNTSKKNRPDWRRVLTAVLALAMILALALPLLGSLPMLANAATQGELNSQISSLKNDAKAAAERKKDLQAQLESLNAQKAQALERKRVLDQQLYALEAQISAIQSQIDAYIALIAQQEEALAAATAKEEEAYARFCQRARAMEEAGDISYWSVLFQADTFTDLLDRLAMVDEIVAYDNTVVEELAYARQEVEETLAQLNESKAGLDEQKAELDVQRDEQAAKVAEAEALFDELKKQADAAQALEEEAAAEEDRIAAAIDKKQKELDKLIASQQIKFTTGSGYTYPLPGGYTHVTSEFGWRTCPYHGREVHRGTDISAPGGTSVYAVQGGVVAVSAYAPSSYGEYVVINHGNGLTTLYAHMQRGSRKVSVGDVVSQGQTIGLVGSTGSATGNHLHIEFKVNGVRQNPRDYIFR